MNNTNNSKPEPFSKPVTEILTRNIHFYTVVVLELMIKQANVNFDISKLRKRDKETKKKWKKKKGNTDIYSIFNLTV